MNLELGSKIFSCKTGLTGKIIRHELKLSYTSIAFIKSWVYAQQLIIVDASY